MGKNVHEKRKRLLTKMKAACLAAVMCVSTLPVLTAQIQPVTAYAQEKTGTVNAGVNRTSCPLIDRYLRYGKCHYKGQRRVPF